MFRLLWAISVHTRYFLRRYMPTNILLDLIRTRRGLKWGIPAMLLGIVYFLAAAVCAAALNDSGLGWLNLLVVLFVWNGLKFLLNGPISLVVLCRVLLTEGSHRRRANSNLDPVKQVAERIAQ